MTEPMAHPPKILKTLLVLIVIFFLLVIIFNLWIRSTLKESVTDIKVTTILPVPEPAAKVEKSDAIEEEAVSPEIEYETPIKGDLLLQ